MHYTGSTSSKSVSGGSKGLRHTAGQPQGVEKCGPAGWLFSQLDAESLGDGQGQGT